ncbi:MAG: hypothetical protein ACI9YL_001847 [Luteibaculaceae bacterium]
MLFPEFVEIINLQNSLISLEGVSLTLGNQALELTGEIGPNQALALGEEQGIMALPNGGFHLQLWKDSLLLDHVRFNIQNHSGPETDGGISLQRISFQDSCSNANNWTWAPDSLGANPGLPDLEMPLPPSPSIVGFNWSDTSLVFSTNVPINSFDYLGNTYREEGSQFSIPISLSNGENLIIIDSIQDCFLRTGKDSLSFLNGAPPTKAVFSEVLFSPLDSCPEFVEIMVLDTGWIQLGELSLVLGTKAYSLLDTVVMAPLRFALSSEEFSNAIVQLGLSVSNSLDSTYLLVGSDTLDILKGLQSRLKILHGSGVPEQSLEKGDINLPCSSLNNWHLCTHVNGHTLGVTNSQVYTYANGLGPHLDSMRVFRSDSILLHFSEPISRTKLPDFTPNLELFSTDPFDPILIKSNFGEEQTVVLSNISDCYSEKGRDTLISLPWIKSPTQFGEIMVTEFTCSTTGDSLFSDRIELSNTSEAALQIGDIEGLRSLGILGVIPPQNSQTFPLDCGIIKDSIITLFNTSGVPIDSCWNPLFKKDNQGYSWKRRATLTCPDLQYHWVHDSIASLGQFPDTILSPFPFGSDINIQFCYPILSLSSDIPITHFQSNFPNTTRVLENRVLENTFAEYTGKSPELIIQNMARCGMPDTNIIIPPIWVPDSLWINEIMYEPEDGQQEFVEIYVPDTGWISLCNFTFQVNNTDEVSSVQTPLKGPFIVLTKTPLPAELDVDLSSQHLFKLPSLNNAGATIQLFSSQGKLLDSLEYKPQWHTGFSSERRGTSLELTDDGLLGKRAWFSSAASWGASPGKSNSIRGRTADAWDVEVRNRLLDPWDVSNPKEIEIILSDLTPGTRINARVVHPRYGSIKQLLEDQMVPNFLELRWDGTVDNGGHISAVGPYLIILQIQEPGQVIEQLKIPVYIWNP